MSQSAKDKKSAYSEIPNSRWEYYSGVAEYIFNALSEIFFAARTILEKRREYHDQKRKQEETRNNEQS